MHDTHCLEFLFCFVQCLYEVNVSLICSFFCSFFHFQLQEEMLW